ncbi:MAG: methylthioribulose 1-phosphate dehydratase [Alphaproteobacteria bacterium]|nr:methylthioribulose 1-phosphate dehydratase [Alphaproteobacteria bacterium]
MSASAEQAVRDVLTLAHHAGSQGWIPATSGNFSARVDAEHAAVTASGGDKAKLTSNGVIVVDINGPPHPRASAEAPLHLALYRISPDIGAVAHVHSMAAVLASLHFQKTGQVTLQGLELLKAFRGNTTHETSLGVPIFDNTQDMDGLAVDVEKRFKGKPLGFGFLLAGHGLYAWGRDTADTLRHLDAFDYLFTLTLKLKGIPV